ncbi:MAG: hypothetical protein AB1405_17025 [Bdellovibrionota bacterium]
MNNIPSFAVEPSGSLRLAFPPLRIRFLVWFPVVWLGVFLAITYLAAARFFQNPVSPEILPLAVVVLVYGLVLTLLLVPFLWQVAGKEEVEISAQGIALSYDFGLFRVNRSWAAAGNLRAWPEVAHPMTRRGVLRGFGLAGGTIAFDAGGKTHHFAIGLSEDEARDLARKIVMKFPNLIQPPPAGPLATRPSGE